MEKVNISIAGHANVGKTTLTRNLIRQKVGEIEDRASVTKKAQTVTHYSIFANITDCPGFQEAGRILDLMEFAETFDLLKGSLNKRGLNEDFEAINSIKNADVVYYVCSLDTVPDKGYESELQLIRNLCPRVVGIVNKKKHNYLEVDKVREARICQWEVFFESNNIDYIEYDFHWDSPRIITQLFQKSVLLLNDNKKVDFEKSLEAYRLNALNDYEKVALAITNLIKKCREIRYEFISENSQERQLKIEEFKVKIYNQSYEYIKSYTNTLRDIYRLNYENDGKTQPSLSQIDNIVQSSFSKGIDSIVSGTAWGAGAGAVMGAYGVAKAITLTLTFTPLGPAILTGLAIGSVIGLMLGASSAAKADSTKKIEMHFSQKDLIDVTILAIATAWASAYQGYGMSDIVSGDRVEKLTKEDILPISEQLQLSFDPDNDIALKAFQTKLIDIFEQIRL